MRKMKNIIVLCVVVILGGCATAPSEHDKMMDLMRRVKTIPSDVVIPGGMYYNTPSYIYTPNFQMYCGNGVCFGY